MRKIKETKTGNHLNFLMKLIFLNHENAIINFEK